MRMFQTGRAGTFRRSMFILWIQCLECINGSPLPSNFSTPSPSVAKNSKMTVMVMGTTSALPMVSQAYLLSTFLRYVASLSPPPQPQTLTPLPCENGFKVQDTLTPKSLMERNFGLVSVFLFLWKPFLLWRWILNQALQAVVSNISVTFYINISFRRSVIGN